MKHIIHTTVQYSSKHKKYGIHIAYTEKKLTPKDKQVNIQRDYNRLSIKGYFKPLTIYDYKPNTVELNDKSIQIIQEYLDKLNTLNKLTQEEAFIEASQYHEETPSLWYYWRGTPIYLQ